MCDDTLRIMAIVKTVKKVEKHLKRELTYKDLQCVVKASKDGTAFEIEGQIFELST
jgi:hypothetical protein